MKRSAASPVFRAWHAGLMAASAATAATAVWTWEQARLAERQHPPQGRYMHLDGVRLHYLEMGAGPTVALLHGNSVYMADLLASGLPQRLARDHRVILFDRPGFGHSQRPRDRFWTPMAQARLLHRALLALGADRPVVLGQSMGALIALAMGLQYPANVAGLVLVSGSYYPTPRPYALFGAPLALPVVGDALRYTLMPLAWRMAEDTALRAAFAPQDVPAAFDNGVPRQMLLRPVQLRAAAEDAAFMLSHRMARRYPQLRLPVSVVAGSEDHLVDTNTQSRRLAAELPRSRLCIVPRSGHMVHYLAPDAIAQQVEAVFADSRQPRAPGLDRVAGSSPTPAAAPQYTPG